MAVRPGGADARLIGPARPLTRTRPMPPGQHHAGDKRRDECSQRAARPDDRPWGRTQPHTATSTRGDPSPQRTRLSARSHPRQGRLRRRDAAGLRPVPDTGPLLAQTRHLRGERGANGPVSHALQTVHHTRNRRPKPA